jgi:hypothetical protein
MNFEWPLFLFGLLIFLVGSAAFLALYAGAAEEEAEHERGALARVTLRICRLLGFTVGEGQGREDEEAEGRRSRSRGNTS